MKNGNSIQYFIIIFIIHLTFLNVCFHYIYFIILVTEAITAAAKFKNLNDFPLDLSIITLDGVYKGAFINDGLIEC